LMAVAPAVMLDCITNYKPWELCMQSSKYDGLAAGVVLGLVVAVVFALVIRLVPAQWLLDPQSRAMLYLLQVPAGLLFVPVASAVARVRRESTRAVLLWACFGALAFDGLVLGFWPSLYGHEGAAHTFVATLLLWAFAWIVAAAMLATKGRTDAAP
jgi:hypothetical protein